MDYQSITKWLTDPKERCIVIEDGKPVLVVMGMEAYRELKDGVGELKQDAPLGRSQDSSEMVNAKLEEERLRARELAARLAMEPERPSSAMPSPARSAPAPEPLEVQPSRVRLEDLPL